MAVIFKKTTGLTDAQTHYCPGCTHGIIHRLVGEVLEEMEVLGTSIGVAPVGCSVLAYNYFNCDMHEAAHGRAPAVATGIKRVFPEHTVFTYQGDGDLASIGTAEIVHAANRGENITVIFVNNTTYGMTGGQMAPTTLIGEKATTCQGGRDPKLHGYPIRMSEMLSTLTGATYIERVRVDTPGEVRKAKKAIRKAFDVQMAGLGFSMVEVLSTCPTNWGMSAPDALQWLRDNMVPYYPVQNFKDIDLAAAKEEK
ncbi:MULTISPECIES: thiamine pyrophosphate-dependent enzyme [Peptostreptococcus]|uniref:2-oxoglutarate oxidoreductase n=1 Tax=Peptostreptococcus porci TaxID=2652282 RepID=A0A6N7XGX4_9FIRM|nr:MULTISPECIES: thiamine pyrophosphate-dependent enzyme [Peptostreptococcus]MDY5739734.1 thiamine pyrophosphate-dependent enzyme [Anaerovoracaceae bacterium]MDD7183744.1 thiamine pyrophosphate-dependent enzyme [Peptostreptococcus porci]MDY2795533.1 thiamine pyrophosphate-dependent enzyme [Peptostreptococcus porci]MDY4129108.1 thiamine pyrophosphate-dependent enzyme [Peptostreptococcus porci]MDY4561859.1 thiamine pyrophosphate-dependent enzyme [Peptostreptococcus porci]